VIGATPDGRIALLGTARGWPAIDDLQSNRATASSHIAARCRKAGHDIAFVNPGVSVGCAADLESCSRELRNDPRQARAELQFLLSALVADVPGGRTQLLAAQTAPCDAAAGQAQPSVGTASTLVV
jgi:hypothetical protein